MKIVIKSILLSGLAVFNYYILEVLESLKTILDTKIALLQFKNSDMGFILSHAYLQPYISYTTLFLINILILYFILRGENKNEKSK